MKVDISICIISYNHELFIRDTICSIAKQNYTGLVELIIGIDVSSDNTLLVAKELLKDFKWPYKLIEYTHRQGMFHNLKNVFAAAEGDYIAVVEGDDYWIDTEKLTKQYNYLDKNLNCFLIGGSIKRLQDKEVETTRNLLNRFSQRYYYIDLIHANRLAFCTVMFRRTALNLGEMDLAEKSPHLDWPLYLIMFKHQPDGYIKVSSDFFGMYRVHEGGVYSNVSQERRTRNLLETIKSNKMIVNNKTADSYYAVFEKYFNDKQHHKPKVNELLRTHGLSKHSVLSFYLQVYGKKGLIEVIFKNPYYWYLFMALIIEKLWRRYL